MSNEDDNTGTQADTDDPISFPPDSRFCPTDEELVECYLIPKVSNLPLPMNLPDVKIFEISPETLADQCEKIGEDEWYFFTTRLRRYSNGDASPRPAVDGSWQPTGIDKDVGKEVNGVIDIIGHKTTLVYYNGSGSRSSKTDWVMQEFRVCTSFQREIPSQLLNANNRDLDECVLCRVSNNIGDPSRFNEVLLRRMYVNVDPLVREALVKADKEEEREL